MKIKSLLLVTVIVLMSLSARAQKKDSLQRKMNIHHYVGFGAGFSTGYGLSYRFTTDRAGLQVNFATIGQQNSYQALSTGLTFLYKLKGDDDISLYLYQGNHYHYFENYHTYSNGSHIRENLINGLGLDLQMVADDCLSINMMFGFGTYHFFEVFSMTGEVALHYRF